MGGWAHMMGLLGGLANDGADLAGARRPGMSPAWRAAPAASGPPASPGPTGPGAAPGIGWMASDPPQSSSEPAPDRPQPPDRTRRRFPLRGPSGPWPGCRPALRQEGGPG